MKKSMCLAALLLSGCATFEPRSVGQNMYVLNSPPPFAIKQANAFCAKQGEIMTPESESLEELVFRCEAENDGK
jgi:uncharacterized lipoprotein YmbA